MSKLYNIDASVHKQMPNGSYRVKVSLPDLGVYINGCIVFPPSPDHPEWAVYMPGMRAGRGAWKAVVEFNKKLPLWLEIYDACSKAVQADMSLQEFRQSDAKVGRKFYEDFAPADIDDEPIDFANIPFD